MTHFCSTHKLVLEVGTTVSSNRPFAAQLVSVSKGDSQGLEQVQHEMMMANGNVQLPAHLNTPNEKCLQGWRPPDIFDLPWGHQASSMILPQIQQEHRLVGQGRHGSISSLSKRPQNLLYDPSHLDTPHVVAMRHLGQQQQEQRMYTPLNAPFPFRYGQQSLGLSGLDMNASRRNALLSNPSGILNSADGWNVMAAYQQRQNQLGAWNTSHHSLPSISQAADQDSELLEFLARQQLTRNTGILDSSIGYPTTRAGATHGLRLSRQESFLSQEKQWSHEMQPDEFRLPEVVTHSVLLNSDNFQASTSKYDVVDPYRAPFIGQHWRSASATGSVVSNATKRRKSSFDSPVVNPTGARGYSSHAEGDMKKIQNREQPLTSKQVKAPSRHRKGHGDFTNKAVELLSDGKNSSKCISDQISPSKVGIRFFNNSAEVDEHGRPRQPSNTTDQTDSGHDKVNRDATTNEGEIVELHAYQKSIWDAFTSEKSLKPVKERKRKVAEKRKSLQTIKRQQSKLQHVADSKQLELDTTPSELSSDPNKIAIAAVDDIVRDSLRERENTLSAASVLMDFLSGGNTPDS